MDVRMQTAGVPRVDAVAPPPKGGLPAVAELTQLTPADRMAIAGVTGYQLSASGQVMNPGGVPPWSYIIAFATQAVAGPPEESVVSDDGHVDIRV